MVRLHRVRVRVALYCFTFGSWQTHRFVSGTNSHLDG